MSDTIPILTLTGIDANTDPRWLEMMLRNYRGLLEFAILRSPKSDQSPRYPTVDVIKTLTESGFAGDFAFHLCGRYARMAHNLEWSELCDTIDFGSVSRVQVNSVRADDQAILNLWRFSNHIGKPVIMQWRGDVFPAVPPGVHLLQDRSGGRGIAETVWSTPDTACIKAGSAIGYAGGLGPDNVSGALRLIQKASKGLEYWIDCESSLRTDDWFDTQKAEAMVSAVKSALPEHFLRVTAKLYKPQALD